MARINDNDIKSKNVPLYGWGLSLDLTGKGHEVAKRVWDSYEHMMLYVNDANDSAIAGNILAVVSDSNEKLNGLYLVKAIAGFNAAGEADASVTETVVEKIGSGSGTITVDKYSEASAQATADNIGQIFYVKADEGEYKAGTYVVTGVGALQKLATSSASGSTIETIAGDEYITATPNGSQVSLALDKAKVIEGLLTGDDFKLVIDKEVADDHTYLYLKSKDGATTYAKVDAQSFVADGFLDSVTLVGDELVFTWNTTAGKTEVKVSLSKYIDVYAAGAGLNLTNNTFSVKVKEGEKYLEATADGLASKGIDDAIQNAVAGVVIPTASVEKGDFVTVASAVTGNNTAYTVGVTTATVASSATTDGLAKASDVKSYVDTTVASSVGAIKLPTVSAADGFVTVASDVVGGVTNYKVGVVTAVVSEVAEAGKLADAKDVKDYIDGKETTINNNIETKLSWTEL